METIDIFDNTMNDHHTKRLRLEPLIFDILKIKYYTLFDTFWKENTIIRKTDRSIIIVERRIHENLAFILRNVFYYARDWAITIFCSDINYN